MYTLVVNHMQGRVFPTVEPIIPQVLREVRRAIASGGVIVVLEIDPEPQSYGPTDERIMSVLREEASGRFERMTGWSEDSANLVKSAVRSHTWPETFRVTGVSTGSCVLTLVTGLIRSGFGQIEVVQDACNCQASSGEDPWEFYPDLPGVVLLQTG